MTRQGKKICPQFYPGLGNESGRQLKFLKNTVTSRHYLFGKNYASFHVRINSPLGRKIWTKPTEENFGVGEISANRMI